MFKEDFREKNQPEIPVNVEGILQGLYPYGSEPRAEYIVPMITLADFYSVKPLLEKCIDVPKFVPTVSNFDKLRVAIKINSTSLEYGFANRVAWQQFHALNPVPVEEGLTR